MNARDATLAMISEYDGSMRSLTKHMGYAPGYLNNVVKRNGIPRADTLVKVANACGYDLLVRRRLDGYEIPIDPYDE